MDPINWLVQNLHLDLITVVIVICSGFFQERLLCKWILFKKDLSYDATLKTLIVSLVASGIWIWLVYAQDRTVKIPWSIYFISYFTATSIYELVIRPIRKYIGRKSGGGSNRFFT